MFLVTGASGFVGRTLCSELVGKGKAVRAAVRKDDSSLSYDIEQINVGSFNRETNWIDALSSVDVVIHTAARVHMMDDASEDPLEDFRKVNTYASLNLASQAAKLGVKRFVFISSIKVNGEMTRKNKPFTPDDTYIPTDPYGLSKYEAEKGLLSLAKETGMEVVIIRPPLVYGPGVKANFASMLKWIHKGVPLPFGAINNKRSLVGLENLVSFIMLCADHKKSPSAKNQVFLISDNEDVSTTELLRKVGVSLGKKARLLPVPMSFMSFGAKLLGKSALANRLFGSLQVDSSKSMSLLGWTPVITMDEQLEKTSKAFLNETNI